MDEKEVNKILEERGLDTILQENYLCLPSMLILLEELGYLDLERYTEDD